MQSRNNFGAVVPEVLAAGSALSFAAGNALVGLRFHLGFLPPFSYVTRAWLETTPHQSAKGRCNISISGEFVSLAHGFVLPVILPLVFLN